jgi:class 3 adenylate cyclase/tetratricopeptide (TPR) repeat protein
MLLSRIALAATAGCWVGRGILGQRHHEPTPMRCPSCQTENPDSSKFCRECGNRLSLTCANCGTNLLPGAKFCSECGAAVGAAGTTSMPAAETAPSAAVSGAERRLVSVLFADLVGSTARAERRDVEDTRELLDRYFAACREIVERYGGAVEKFIGDAVMAVWGTPTAHEDDAERAVRAALDLVERVRQVGEEARGPELAARAAVMTGEAAVSLAAEGQGMVAGDLVNSAARLQALAEPGSVLVGATTRRATESAIAYEEAGAHQIKGREEPLAAHRAMRVVAQRRGAGRAEALDPPFVGRQAELRLLKDLFHTTGEEGRPRLVTVLGQAGIGKSRLAWELLKYVDGVTEIAYWHSGRSPAYGEGVTFWALGEMVRMRAGIGENEAPDSSRAKLEASLAEFVADGAERARIQPALEELLGLSSPDDPSRPGETIFTAWRTFFERISQRGTVVMVFEDLHWADPGLLDFIEHLLDWARTHPILVVGLARPELLERREDWGLARRNHVSVVLEPLAEEPMRELLGGMVRDLGPSAVEAIVERAAGIPLYAVEMVRMLMDEGRVERTDDGAYRAVGALTELAVPESLHALIAARLDALDPSERQLVQGAAVLGKSFHADALAAVIGDEPAVVESRLRDLVRRNLLVVEADPRSPERGQYVFVQALIRDVAHATLARRDRRRLHLAAARHLEALGDPELAGVLATHYAAAYEAQPSGPEGEAVAAQARVALRAAADRAARLASHDQALTYLRQALGVVRELAERAEVLEAAARAAASSAQHTAAIELIGEAVALRESLGDRARLLAASTLQVRCTAAIDVPGAMVLVERAAHDFEDLAETREYIEMAFEMTRCLMRLGRDRETVAWADRVLPSAERVGTLEATLEILNNRATSLSNLDRLREGAAELQGVIARAELAELPYTEIRAIVNISFATEADDPRMARNERGLELIRTYGLRNFVPFLLSNTVDDLFMRGDWDEALALTQEFIGSAVSDLERQRLAAIPTDLLILRGELDRAGVDAAYESWREIKDPQVAGAFALSDARMALAEGRLDEAAERAMAAYEIHPPTTISALYTAGHAAIWAGTAGLADRISPLLAGRLGRVRVAHSRVLDAGISALRGEVATALETYRECLRFFGEVELGLFVAMTGIDMVATIPAGAADLTDVVADARRRLDTMGAVVLARILDRLEAVRAQTSRDGSAVEARSDAAAAPSRIGS